MWHAEGKQLLARWARQQPGVEQVSVEHRTADGRRRSDVGVRLATGVVLGLEVQYSPLSDVAWIRRHEDYRHAGVVDLWFWHSRLGSQHVVLEHGAVPWNLDVVRARLRVPIAPPHQRCDGWWDLPARPYADHYPPCPGDDIRHELVSLLECGLAPSGLLLPDHLRADLEAQLDVARTDASDVRDARRRIAEREYEIAADLRLIDLRTTQALRRPRPGPEQSREAA
jgi:hypothetical protein